MKKLLSDNKALSPLVATLLLLAFALVVGTVTMNWGKSYIENIGEPPKEYEPMKSSIVVNIEDIDTPLKKLQIEHITGQISEQEYIARENQIINP